MDENVEVRQVAERHRFEIDVDAKRVGLSTYRDDGGVRTFIHTEINPDHEGRGLAGRLIRTALDETRGAGLLVVPQCPYVKTFIERHQEYADLVVDEATP